LAPTVPTGLGLGLGEGAGVGEGLGGGFLEIAQSVLKTSPPEELDEEPAQFMKLLNSS
jgi:hypothetical protein